MPAHESYTIKELLALYNVSWKVWRAWLRPILPQLAAAGYVPGQRRLTPNQQTIIFNQVGQPPALTTDTHA
ncbi:hypothetical protein [Fibrella aquatilis]|uniref:DUF4248 domain-containing protein n=1 Tax=Fibrella aquatilis TaxID=2817059 RepID=A0A939JV08_9BACT|nr:hypothetical protein [Fibrella aquatilis]MBO0930352.1 hypothetical protein [Fibrella aquatilis]